VQCRDVRDLGDAFFSDQLLVETTNDIVFHLEACPSCRAEFAARRALRTTLQSAFDRSTDLAPRPEFVEALSAGLRPGSPRTMSRRAWLESWWPVAAGLAALAGGGLFARGALRRSRLAVLAQHAAGDHQNCALKFNLAERPISLEEAAQRYGILYASLATVDPPGGLPRGSADVVDRHSCVYEGRRFGHVVFRYDGHVVSLLLTVAAESLGTAPEMLLSDGPLHVASFAAGDHIVFVVSDLDERETLQFARALAEPVLHLPGA